MTKTLIYIIMRNPIFRYLPVAVLIAGMVMIASPTHASGARDSKGDTTRITATFQFITPAVDKASDKEKAPAFPP